MSQRNASQTAFGTLYMRGVHQLLDAQPLILDDPVSIKILGPEAILRIQNSPGHYRTPESQVLRSHVVLRSRYTEDCLRDAAARGITQYIILGAGFDTFAFRQPVWARHLKIFEVDQPASQRWKTSKLDEAGLSIPSNVKFAGIDFEFESLRDGLTCSGVSADEPAFFSWLGVTMYLQEEAADTVLRAIAAFPARSEVVFTFTQPPETFPGREGQFHTSLSEKVSGAGEPFISYYTPPQIEKKLRDLGFKTVVFLSKEEAHERYYRNRPQDLVIPGRSAIARAVL